MSMEKPTCGECPVAMASKYGAYIVCPFEPDKWIANANRVCRYDAVGVGGKEFMEQAKRIKERVELYERCKIRD